MGMIRSLIRQIDSADALVFAGLFSLSVAAGLIHIGLALLVFGAGAMYLGLAAGRGE